MPTLYVENVLRDLYEALRKRAKSQRRSIADEKLANALSGDFPVTWLGAFSRIIAQGWSAQPRRFSPLNAAVL